MKNVQLLAAICFIVVSGNKRLVLHSDQDILTRFVALESESVHLKQELAELKQKQESEVAELKQKQESESAEFKQKQAVLENQLLKNNQGSSTYTRWGRKSCPGNETSLVYKGYAAGNVFSAKGGGVDTLCLPDDPTWNKYNPSAGSTLIYGSEFEGDHTSTLLGYEYHNQDIPCALCHTDRSLTVMIPGRATCYPGWAQEYTGYLVSSYSSYAGSDYNCLDENPEAVTHSNGNDDGHLMYFVTPECSKLSCPPYVAGRQLACVVCSK